MGLHRFCWKRNYSCVLSRLGNKSSKFYKITWVLNKIMLKKFSGFFVDIVHINII